ncbi:MAG: NAD(P)-dependent alcohol dehydrogenase [Anaerolineae bacterium]
MKAIIYEEYGLPEVLTYKEVATPTPAADEVLVKVHATSINISDWYSMLGKPFLVRLAFGLRKPNYPFIGGDVAGVVEGVGDAVTQFKVGDAVFGDLSAGKRGSFAEYVAVPETALVLKPDNISFEQAAAIPLAGVTALQGIRAVGNLQAGQSVLINGASGGVGTLILQLAKRTHADITAVCSTRNIEMVQSLSADHIIDYTQENVTQGDKRYDVIIAVNGYHPLWDYRRILKDGGTYLCIGGTMPQIFQSMLLGGIVSLGTDKKFKAMGTAKSNQDDLKTLQNLLQANELTPVIDKRFPLARTADAMRYYGEVGAQGKIVITVNNS